VVSRKINTGSTLEWEAGHPYELNKIRLALVVFGIIIYAMKSIKHNASIIEHNLQENRESPP